MNNGKAAYMLVYPTEKAGKIATSRKSLMAVHTGLPLATLFLLIPCPLQPDITESR